MQRRKILPRESGEAIERITFELSILETKRFPDEAQEQGCFLRRKCIQESNVFCKWHITQRGSRRERVGDDWQGKSS